MKNFFRMLGQFIVDNTKDPWKSPAHFLRSSATSVITMEIAGFLLFLIMSYFGYGTNYRFIDELLVLSIATACLYLSKLFIKE